MGNDFQGVALDPSTNSLVPTSTTKSDWSERLPSKEEAAAIGGLDQAQQEQQQLAQDQIAAQKERDFNARLAAEQKAADAVENQKAMAAAQAKYQEDRQRIMGEINTAAAEKAKAAKYGDYWDDKTTGQRVLSAIAVGLGQGAAIQGGGENAALKMFQHAQEMDQTRKKERLAFAVDELRNKGANLEQLDRFNEMAMKNIEAQRVAQDRATAAYIEGLGASYPQFATAAQEAAAKLKTDSAARLFENTAKIHEVRRSGGSSTTTPGTASGSARAPSSTDVQNFASMEANAKLAERMLELQKSGGIPTPEQYREYTQNKNLMISRAHKEMEGGAFEVWKSKIGRGVTALPESVYPEKMTPAQREYMDIEQALSHQRGVQKFGQSAMGSPEGRMEYMNPVTASPGDSPADIKRKGALMAEEFIVAGKDASAISKAGERSRIYSAQNPKPATKGGQSLSPENQRALQWATSHPKDPRAKEVIQKLRAEMGQ